MWIFSEYLQRKSGGGVLVVKDEWVFGSGEAQKDITACAVCVRLDPVLWGLVPFAGERERGRSVVAWCTFLVPDHEPHPFSSVFCPHFLPEVAGAKRGSSHFPKTSPCLPFCGR